jgi:hypothetical protein
MSSFDYNAPAELFLAKTAKGSRTSIDGSQRPLRPSVEDLRTPKARRVAGGWDDRFSSSEIQRLYYPLRKPG